MRTLLGLVLLLATARTAAADDAAPELVVMPDLEAASSARLRFGLAPVDGVRDRDRGEAAHTVWLTAVRVAHAPRGDLELSLAMSAAVLASNGYETGSTLDPGLGVPAFGVEWTPAAGERVRFGLGALAAAGGVDRSTDPPHAGDVAAGAFFFDPELPWSGAHMGLVHGGAGWSDGVTAVRADVGIQAYAGGVLPEPVSILRFQSGVARRVGDGFTLSLEALVETDVHHEALGDDTDVVPAVTVGLRRTRTRCATGAAFSVARTGAPAEAADAGFAFLVDVSCRYR
jgi:hypothetical protein